MNQGNQGKGQGSGTGGTIAGRAAVPVTRNPGTSGAGKTDGEPAGGSPGAAADREQAEERAGRDTP